MLGVLLSKKGKGMNKPVSLEASLTQNSNAMLTGVEILLC